MKEDVSLPVDRVTQQFQVLHLRGPITVLQGSTSLSKSDAVLGINLNLF